MRSSPLSCPGRRQYRFVNQNIIMSVIRVRQIINNRYNAFYGLSKCFLYVSVTLYFDDDRMRIAEIIPYPQYSCIRMYIINMHNIFTGNVSLPTTNRPAYIYVQFFFSMPVDTDVTV